LREQVWSHSRLTPPAHARNANLTCQVESS